MKSFILTSIFIIIVVLAVLVLQFYTYSPSCKDDKGKCYQTTLLRVVDGDTIKTEDNDRSIRFALSSAPELTEKGGIEAKEFIESICPVGSIIFIDEDDLQLKGIYERMVAKVYCKGVVLNQSLLVSNLGTIDTRYCNNSEFAQESWASECN